MAQPLTRRDSTICQYFRARTVLATSAGIRSSYCTRQRQVKSEIYPDCLRDLARHV
jgi:hypothetical protein